MPYTLSYAMPFPMWVIWIMILWTLPWKGYALWKAAKNGQKEWFVVLLVVNTLAILEILYLKFWQKKSECCDCGCGPECKCECECCKQKRNEKTQ